MNQKKNLSLLGPLLFLTYLFFLPSARAELFGVERREDIFDYNFGYFIYPMVSNIPGLGTAAGAGATISNIGKTDLDFTGIHLKGDFDVSIATFLNIPLVKELLVLDAGVYSYDVASQNFPRGEDTGPEDYILPKVNGEGYFAQLTFYPYERMLETYVRIIEEDYNITAVLDKEGNEFSNADLGENNRKIIDLGFMIDLTDHRHDPRKGIRFEYMKRSPENTDPLTSDFYIEDKNLTFFIPFGRRNTWAFNYYQSDATITKQATTNRTDLENEIGLGCESIPSHLTTEIASCEATEAKRIDERIALNESGRSTPLGGSQRLRGYPNRRFSAGHTRFIGSEFRWNLGVSESQFDIILMKGILKDIQIAPFAEIGAFADKVSDLNFKNSSYGAGIRALFAGGVVFRLDWAKSDEDQSVTVFVDYPWGLNPVDNSTR